MNKVLILSCLIAATIVILWPVIGKAMIFLALTPIIYIFIQIKKGKNK